MKKLFLTLFCLIPILLYAEQADSTMQEIQGKATIADTDVLIVADADTVYWKITYLQFKSLMTALYEVQLTNEAGLYSVLSDVDQFFEDEDTVTVVVTPTSMANYTKLAVDSVYRSGSNIVFVQRDGSTITMVDSTAAAGSGISNVVEDTTPQLGGNLDIQAYNIEGVDATEFGYVDGVTSDIQGQFNALPATWQGDISDSLDAYYIGVTSRGTIIWGESVDSGWVEITVEALIDSLINTYGFYPSGANPTTDATRKIGIDTDDNFIEFYNGTTSRVVSNIIMQSYTILYPDSVQPRSDDVILAHFPSEIYPHGVTITYVAISASASASDTHVLEEWSDAVGTSQATVHSLALSSATKVESTSPTDGAMAADSYLNINLDGTTDNINWIQITIGYYANPGD